MARQRGRFIRGGRGLVDEAAVVELARNLAASIGKSSKLPPITRGECQMIRGAARSRWDVPIKERRRIICQLVVAVCATDEDPNLVESATATLVVLHSAGWLTTPQPGATSD